MQGCIYSFKLIDGLRKYGKIPELRKKSKSEWNLIVVLRSIDKFSFYWFILFVLQIGAAAGLFPTTMLLVQCILESMSKIQLY